MTPNIWLMLLAFVLGLALTWFAMTATVTRNVARGRTVAAADSAAPAGGVVTDRETVHRQDPEAQRPGVHADEDVQRHPHIDEDPTSGDGRGTTR